MFADQEADVEARGALSSSVYIVDHPTLQYHMGMRVCQAIWITLLLAGYCQISVKRAEVISSPFSPLHVSTANLGISGARSAGLEPATFSVRSDRVSAPIDSRWSHLAPVYGVY